MSTQPVSDLACSLLRDLERDSLVSVIVLDGEPTFFHKGENWTLQAVELIDAGLAKFERSNRFGDGKLVLPECDDELAELDRLANGGAR